MAETIVTSTEEFRSVLRPNYYKHKQHQPGALDTAVKGSINELRVCVHFLNLGYEVFRNVSATGKGDIIIWKRGKTPIVIDVKAVCYGVYVRKDGVSRPTRQMNKSKCPGVITIGITEEGEITCDEFPDLCRSSAI